MSTTLSLRTKLDRLHAEYVETINQAIAANQDDEVASLAAGYDEAATLMVAEHEGLTHLLPLNKNKSAEHAARSTQHRWFGRLGSARRVA